MHRPFGPRWISVCVCVATTHVGGVNLEKQAEVLAPGKRVEKQADAG